MLQHYKRSDRIGDLMQREISDIIQRQIKDPRIGFCTVMRVDVSDDLSHAKVRVSIMGSEAEQKNTMIGLKSASNFIRREIGRRIELRILPELVFLQDKSVDHSIRIAQLIKEGEEDSSIKMQDAKDKK